MNQVSPRKLCQAFNVDVFYCIAGTRVNSSWFLPGGRGRSAALWLLGGGWLPSTCLLCQPLVRLSSSSGFKHRNSFPRTFCWICGWQVKCLQTFATRKHSIVVFLRIQVLAKEVMFAWWYLSSLWQSEDYF